MFLNQYFLSNTTFVSPENGRSIKVGDFKIWAHNHLEITEYQINKVHLVLLGFAFNPSFPEKSNLEILQDLAENAIFSIAFFNGLNQLTGRFVLITHEGTKTIILNDPAGQRQVFYMFQNDNFYATSSPKLFYDLTDFKFQISNEKLKIVKSRRYKYLEEWFPGDEYLDNKLIRLLPNFMLPIETKQTKRIPFTVKPFSKRKLREYVQNMIYGSMEACINRFDKIYSAVTAGGDSRLILSCSPHEEKINYFLFSRETENNVDLRIAKELAEKRKLSLSVINPSKLTEEFTVFYKLQFLYPRILSKLQNIEWLSRNISNTNSVIIAGYAGEMLRNSTNSINPYQKKFNSDKDFVDYLHYPKTRYISNSLKSWIESTQEYLHKCTHLSYLDLFHWEQHMAPYCAQYAYEQDISGVEIFCPLANRQMILNLIHNTTNEERSSPNGIIYHIINETFPEWKDIPYNPKPFLKKLKDEVFKVLPLNIINRIINR